MDTIDQNLEQIRQRIRAAEQHFGRPAGSVSLLAVSKTRPTQDVLAAYHAGQRLFGESYVQEALEKIEALKEYSLEWHFIGPVQSNKTKHLATHFDWVHSVDRFKIAQRLNDQRPGNLTPLNICLQINVSGEASKAGAQPEAVPELARAIAELPRLRLRGLMAIPARHTEFATQRQPFHRLRVLQAQLIDAGLPLDTLSMGMTNDLEAAIAEGSTLVRVGAGIFGPRAATAP